MTSKGFSQKELGRFRALGFESIESRLASGFNYYPRSIENQIGSAVYIPIKYGHRNTVFISLLETEVEKEFNEHINKECLPRKTIYRWHKLYDYPLPEDNTKIYDIEKQCYISNKHELRNASDRLIAECDEKSLLFVPKTVLLVDLARFLLEKGSFFLTDERGELIPAPEGSTYPFKVNPNRISDEAYKVPIIITNYDKSLQDKLPSFAPVSKLFKINGTEEISVYLDKTRDDFIKNCRLKFKGERKKLANKLFRDEINFEGQI